LEHDYAMILSGGGGTRLWPMSRKDKPKQLLPLIDEQSMFKTSVARLAPLFPPERIFIVTGRKYAEMMQADVPEIPQENFIIEPHGRDSAAATALGISVIHKRDPQATVAMLAVDHHIAKPDVFLDVLKASSKMAQEGYIVTLGVSPSFPATAFGYIRQGEKLQIIDGFNCHKALQFTEKPNVVTATTFLASGHYTWNSGMFIWKTETALKEFQRQQPVMFNALQTLMPTIDTPQYEKRLDEIWGKMPKISIDFAIMEGAKRMVVIPVDIGWSDVGSWASLFEVLELDKFGNGFRGKTKNHIILDTHDSLVVSDRMTVTIGIKDLIIVDTEDALLICQKDRSQEIKEVVKHLRETDQDHYL
jgi:mannose-1-phosphate guanylyltransferase